MGAAPRTLEDLDSAQGQSREVERRWLLDTATGELKVEHEPSEGERSRPKAIRVARQIFD